MITKLVSRILLSIIAIIFLSLPSIAQDATGSLKVEPPSWWVGMESSQLQLIVHGKDISITDVAINYPGVVIKEVQKVENPNYLFIHLELQQDAKPGKFDITFKKGKRVAHKYTYELRQKGSGAKGKGGFTPDDVIYLLMPDRFANGDTTNDSHPSMLEKVNRSNPSGRHGGDIKGIQDNLSYIKDLGVTAIWMNPLIENNNPAYSYHGYAITDFYKIDARFGTNDDYVNLVKKAHETGLKVIMDMIFNHCGINHWFIKDLPMKGWIHEFPEFTRSNFRAESLTDPYASEYDKKIMVQGWFDTNMPDLDQRNPLLSTYLIQNSIWWIEYSGIDGIRMDTQPYPYKEMMAEWAKRVFQEYPGFNIVGEAWMNRESMTSYYQKDTKVGDGYNSNIPSVTDFPMHSAINKAFTEAEGWTEGMARLYYVLAQDFLYTNPSYNLTFVDNHDLNRFYTSIKEDKDAYKMAMAFLLTTRGIPMIYYGTEFLMGGEEHKGHGDIRQDFPGGWPGDAKNYFTASGRSTEQNEAFNYLQTILKWRESSQAVKSGSLKHYIPQNGVYVYFREAPGSRAMVIINSSKEKQVLQTSRFAENLKEVTRGTDIITGRVVDFGAPVEVEPRSALIIELAGEGL